MDTVTAIVQNDADILTAALPVEQPLEMPPQSVVTKSFWAMMCQALPTMKNTSTKPALQV